MSATTIAELVLTAAAERPDSEALVTETGRWTYTDLIDQVAVVAEHLWAAGARRAVRLLVMLGNDERHVFTMLAASRIGAVVVPVDPRITGPEIAEVAATVNAPFVVLDDALVHSDVIDLFEASGVTRITVYGDDLEAVPIGDYGAAFPDDDAAIFTTSGTTGHPRLVRHSNASLLRSIRALAAAPQSAAGQQTWLTPLPLHTIGGSSIVHRVLAQGDRLILPARFHPRQMVETVELERATCLGLAPSLLALTLQVPNLDRYDLSSVAIVGLGAASLAPELAERAEATFEAMIVNSYGSTELGGPVLLTVGNDTTFAALPSVDVDIVGEDGQPVPDGEAGELSCRVDSLSPGYLNHNGTTDPLDRMTRPGWYRTGDLGRRLPTGRVELLGRSDERASLGGFSVYPVEVERILLTHDAVDQAAVVGVPGRASGDDQLWAFVIRRDGSDVTTAELAEHCRSALSWHKRPTRISIEPAFPMTASGKVKKHVLVQRLSGGRT